MSGAVQASATTASDREYLYSVTIGTDGAGVFGFLSGSYGAIPSPSYRGMTISLMRSGVANFGFALSNLSYNAADFSRVVVQDTSGALRTYLAANASISGGIVAWGDGTDKAWTATTPSPRLVTIYR